MVNNSPENAAKRTFNLYAVTALILLFLIPITLAYPKPVGTVNDFAGIIEPEDENRIASAIDQIRKETTVEIAIVTTNDLGGEDIAMYATNLGNEWGVGKKDKDNGLVLVIVPNERKYFFAVGSGLEGTLNDAKAARIGRNVLVPYFRSQQYGEGIIQALQTVKGIVSNDPSVTSQYEETPENKFYDTYEFLLVMVVFIIFSLVQTFTQKKTIPKLLGYRFGAWTIIVFAAAMLLMPLAVLSAILAFIFFVITIFELAARALGFKGKGGGGWLGGFSGGGGSFSGGFGGGGFSGGGGGGGW